MQKASWSSSPFCVQIYNSCQNSQATGTKLGINNAMPFQVGERKHPDSIL